MVQQFHRLKETPSQTAGPYVHIGTMPNFCGIPGIYPADLGASMVTAETKGERIVITGHVYDGAGQPVRDALLELWQADANGLYNADHERRGTADPAFSGWGRQPADPRTGAYRFETIKPGRVPWKDGQPMAPHASLWIAARGINIALHSRIYFSDETAANNADPVLARVGLFRRATLIAERDGEDNGMAVYRHDIRLQGDGETVFFDI
ncbi:Protocatechuate 3,4-dioxygenase alpha chain [Hartmannibacter diazotrophicus]|uniref:Protocatechuate 3,4-dioxygenase alpha chain n=1 Tax=Hartmannibacter diazotrophicus TaxID=1482074 RepID=A0A2C9D0X6_9HYPH|nr:protocatechuate 3,4-dioxygenase subunit alpha [Hartmannibacter diazotrophicus]SON53839.1 Protocatechuate 3,4-dioxygenase alpha chain [Hartmannibacter diazotrophicus]